MTPAWFDRLERFPFAVDVTDSNNHLVYVNRAFEKFYGYPRAKILGLLPHFLVPDSVDRRLLKESMRQVVESHQSWMGVQPNVTARGEKKDVFLVALPVLAAENVNAGFIYFASEAGDWNKLVLSVFDLLVPQAFGMESMSGLAISGTDARPVRRQEKILSYYRLGYTAKQIASMMGISPSTVRSVKSHLNSGRRGAARDGQREKEAVPSA